MFIEVLPRKIGFSQKVSLIINYFDTMEKNPIVNGKYYHI